MKFKSFYLPKIIEGHTKPSEDFWRSPEHSRRFPKIPRNFRRFPKITRTIPKTSEEHPNISEDFRISPELLRRFPKITRVLPKVVRTLPKISEDHPNTSQDFSEDNLRRSRKITGYFRSFPKFRKIEGPVCFSSETVTVVFLANLYYLTSYIINKYRTTCLSNLKIIGFKKFLWQPNWTWPAASSNFGCPRNFFFHPIISRLDSM